MSDEQLLDELYSRFSPKSNRKMRLRFFRKKLFYSLVISSTKAVKRLLDILLSLLAITLASPLFLLLALCVYYDDSCPIIYISKRVGKHGRLFNLYKFRSMYRNAERQKKQLLSKNRHTEGVTFKMKEDPRITPIGKFLRRSSLDELPQLFNVLKGDMSLVGPRPPLIEEVKKYGIEERKRLHITPGLTGLWQVSGRASVDFSKQVKLDLAYIESQSLWGDLIILLKTIPAVLCGRGAY